MRRFQVGSHTKFDLKVHPIWVPKYRKRVLVGQVALEHEIDIISGKVASDHVHMLVAYRPTQNVAQIVQYFKATSSRDLLAEFAHLKKTFWGRGYCAISSGNITDEMIQQHIDQQEGEPVVEDCRFTIDP